jgi:hypothetical protein
VKVLPGVQVLNGATTPTSASGYIAEDRISSYLGLRLKRKYFVEVLLEEMVLQDFPDVRWGSFMQLVDLG